MFLGIIFVIIFLSILVFVHELGHFLAGKYFGLWIEEFGVGLPPRAWGRKIGETIYSINWLPFGGFVKIYGENREDEEAAEEVVIQSQISEEVISSTDRGTEILIEESETDILVGPDKNRSFNSLLIWKRIIILSAGVIMNFLLGWFIISLVFSVGVPQAIVVTEVQPNSPASSAGIVPGDYILNTKSVDELIGFINVHAGEKIILEIKRDGKAMNLEVVPRLNPPVHEGALGIGLIEAGVPRENIFKALWDGLKVSLQTLRSIVLALSHLIKGVFLGEKGLLSGVTGPVGIVKITTEAGSMGFIYLLQLLALISLNLAIINILPFPALDGGRLLFLIIEKIKGSPLPVKFEKYANAVGMALLLILMIAITIKDIGNLF